MYRATCSQCGAKFGAKTRSKLLSKLRDHLWGKHRQWMVNRIKAGLKRSSKGDNPTWRQLLVSIVSGIFPPAGLVMGVKKEHVDLIRPVMTALSPILPPEAKGAWLALQALVRIREGD